jgi:glycosyltransferase involved in cell wall biosynthesis
MVGDGSMRADLAKMALADHRICCTGRLSGTALLDVYAAADVFVLPSRFEPWGLVINEAMACGLPVIATDRVGCVDDLVIDGETGYVVSSESMDALTSVMTKLCQDQILREKMAYNSRSLIAGWTIQKEAEIIVNTWDRALEL